MINLGKLFKNYKHKQYRLTHEENLELKLFIEENNTKHSWDSAIALRLFAYQNYKTFTKSDVELFETYLEPNVIDVARKSALWSLILIWKRYDNYNDIIAAGISLEDTEQVDNSEFRSACYMCLAEILFQSPKNTAILEIASSAVEKFLQAEIDLADFEGCDQKYFAEQVYGKYFEKINGRPTYSNFTISEMRYYLANFDRLLGLDIDLEEH